VQRVIVSGEPAGSIPATKKMIEEMWGAKCGDTAGMTELGTIMMFECESQPGGCHVIEDHFIEEVIDPETGEPVPYGTQGERVAGVRYRAWQPTSCLHPTIPVDAPLTIELVDTWLARSLGGCVYHVAHPGGLAYENLPVNANEAESRRVSRFSPLGHTPGRMVVAPPVPNPDFPFTLDLRRS